VLVLAVVATVSGGCDGCEHPSQARADAVDPDATADAELDAARDAAADAARDATIDASNVVSPACTTTPTQLLDVSPSQIDRMALVGNTLYVSVYQNTGQVLAIDLTTGAPSDPPLATSGATSLFAVGGDAFATDATAGTIWRLHPGTTPTAVVTGRPTPTVATSDGTYVYWAESDGTGNPAIVRRQLLTGGTVGTVMTSCAFAHRLFVVGSTLYCLEFQAGAIEYAPSDGSSGPTSIGTDGYPADSMILDGNSFYIAGGYNYPRLWGVPLPSGPATKLHELTTFGRYAGLAATPSYIYTVDTGAGIARFDRTTYTPQVIHSSVLDGGDPVVWNGQLYYAEQNPQTSGLRYVMHCID
jgi:hypothetical protein